MSIEKILVIKLRHLGDVLLATPVFSVVGAAFPSAQIDAYIWKEGSEILEGHPAISKIHFYDRKWKQLSWVQRIPHELALLRAIRREKYDLVLNLTEGDRGVHAAFISGAKTRVGFIPKSKLLARSFTHLVKSCPTPKHVVERDLDAARVLGIDPKQQDRELFFFISKADQERAKTLIDFHPYVVIHAPSRWRFKCLPQALMAQVIDLLDVPVVLTGTASEREYVQGILDLSQKKGLNLAGKTSLKEMGAIFKGAYGLITVDSVSLHIASALKIPTVALFGPTSEKNWGPWRNRRATVIAQNRSCRPCYRDGCGGSKISDCLYRLSPRLIVQALHRIASTEMADGERAASASSLLILNFLDM